MILGALVASAALLPRGSPAGAVGETTIPIEALSLVEETSTPEAQNALAADDEAGPDLAARVYPARAYPARVHPARVHPARVHPARVYPARAYPARVYYRGGTLGEADGSLTTDDSGVELPSPDVSL